MDIVAIIILYRVDMKDRYLAFYLMAPATRKSPKHYASSDGMKLSTCTLLL